MKAIIIDGLRFVRDDKRGYHRNNCTRKYLHRYLYEKEHGELPSNIHVHHIDHDRSNNDLSNLMAMSIEDHMAYHGNNMSDERLDASRRNMEQNARPAAIAWHQSEDGRAWHARHYEQTKGALHARRTYECKQCGREFESVREGYCTNACKAAYRRASGIDNITLICPICDEVYETDKYRQAETCSRSCANRLRGRRNAER